MAIAVGDVWRFSLVQNLFTQVVVNTFALKVDAAPAVVTETSFVNTLFNDTTGRFNSAGNLRAAWRGAQTNEVIHTRWEAFRVTAPTTQMFTRDITTDIAGQYSSTAETANIAASLTRRGALGGKRNRGRIAIAGVPVTGMAAGLWTGASITDLNVCASFLKGGITLADGTHFVMGYWSPAHVGKVKGVNVNYPALFVEVDAVALKPQVRVQRSRTRVTPA